jgi:hypothetical protein
MFRTLACLTTLALATTATATPRENAHVRPVNTQLERLIARGVERSPTLRDLIDRLERTDVAVFVEYDMALPSGVGGALRFVARAGSLRLLRISVQRVLSESAILRMIGHELQHALEVAAAPEVVDQNSLTAFYRRVDEGQGQRFDTNAAQKVGDLVADDLGGKRQATPAAQPPTLVGQIARGRKANGRRVQ